MRYPQVDAQKICTTTVTSLRKMPAAAARAKLEGLARGNADRVLELVRTVGAEPESRRMVRLGSGLWPMADHEEFQGYALDATRQALSRVGELAATLDVRVSSHPGQYNVLASPRADVVERTLVTLGQAAEQLRLCGGTNMVLHCNGSGGPALFGERVALLTPDARERLIVENDEYSTGTEELLAARLPVPIVLDPHHHWINTGRWPERDVYERVRATWPAGRHPKIHYSYPRTSDDSGGWPAWTGNRNDMRGHHDAYPNRQMNAWILRTCAELGFDVMCESKHKDVASRALWDQAHAMGLVAA